MYCQYRKKNGEVVSVSTGKNQVNELAQLKVLASNKDKLLSRDYNAFVKNGKLVFIKRSSILDKEKTEETIDKIKKGEHTNEELAELLKQLTK